MQNWIQKADNDLKVARHESGFDKDERVTDAICFHCQQAVEKFLKAFLVYKNIDFGKTHNLEYLLELCAGQDTEFRSIELGNLTFFAVEVRYPDDFYMPTDEDVEESLSIADSVRTFVMSKI